MAFGLSIKIGADISELKKELNSAGGALDRFAKSIGPSITRLAKFSAAAVAAGTAIGTVMVKQSMSSIDALGKMSDQIGISTDALVKLRHAAAETAGVSDGQLDMALRRMTRRIEEAAQGSGAAAGALRRLGLDASELSKMTPDQQFLKLSDAMKTVDTQSQRLQNTMAIFDTEGMPLVNTLSKGADEIRRYGSEAERLGLVLNRIDAAQVENANTALSKIGQVLRGVFNRIAVRFAPLIEALGKKFAELALETKGFQSAIDTAFRVAISGAGHVANAIQAISAAFSTLSALAQTFRFAAIEAFRYVVEGAVAMNDTVLKMYNATVRTMNNLPGVNLSEIGLVGESEFMQTIRGMSDDAYRAMSDAWDKTAEKWNAPIAADGLKQFIADVQKASRQAAEAAAGAGGSGVDEESSGMGQKQIEEIQKRLEAMRQANLDEIEIENEKHAKNLETLNLAFAERLLAEEDWHAKLEEESARHQGELNDIEEKSAKERNRIAQQEAAAKQRILGGALSGLTTLMNSESRKMFEVGKIAAISQSLIATYQGMSEALKLGWPLGPAAAAAIGAAGFANVASIRSQSFGGGGGAPQAPTAAVNEAMTPVQSSPERIIRVEGINPSSLFTGEQVYRMLEEAAEDGHLRFVLA